MFNSDRDSFGAAGGGGGGVGQESRPDPGDGMAGNIIVAKTCPGSFAPTRKCESAAVFLEKAILFAIIFQCHISEIFVCKV